MSRDVARARKEGIMSVLVDEAWIHVTRGSSFLSSVASPTTSKTAATHEPECSTCRYRARLSATCLTSRSGLPKIRQRCRHLPVVCLHLRRLNHFHFEPRAFSVAVVHLVLVRQ